MCDPIFEHARERERVNNTKNSFVRKNVLLITGLFSAELHKRNYFVETSKNLRKQRSENKFIGLSK